MLNLNKNSIVIQILETSWTGSYTDNDHFYIFWKNPKIAQFQGKKMIGKASQNYGLNMDYCPSKLGLVCVAVEYLEVSEGRRMMIGKITELAAPEGII